jgi:hypothetical protein
MFLQFGFVSAIVALAPNIGICFLSRPQVEAIRMARGLEF